jgi:predicted HNH restriction endonuclease
MKGCGQTRFLEVHHLMPRAAGGKNSADNLITLCASCHRLLHERYLRGDLLTGGMLIESASD